MLSLTVPKMLQHRQLFYAMGLFSLLLLISQQVWFIRPYVPSNQPSDQETFQFFDKLLNQSAARTGVECLNQPPAGQSSPVETADQIAETAVPLLSKIAKVTVILDNINASGADRCLQSHKVQNDMHGYTHFLGTTKLVEDRQVAGPVMSARWSKHAYLLHLILTELQKPKDERLEWLFWFDADILILNPYIKLETFLPPAWKPEAANLKFLVARNWDGINDGAFLIKVDIWAVSLLSGVLAYPIDHLQQKPFPHEQEVLSHLLHTSIIFQHNWAIVPMRWFNSLPVNNVYTAVDGGQKWILGEPLKPVYMDNGERVINSTDGTDVTLPWKVMKGDMALHFAGVQHRKTWIVPWADRAERLLPEWSGDAFQQSLQLQTDQFWTKWEPHVPVNLGGHKPIEALGNDTWF